MMPGHTQSKLNISRQSLDALEDYVYRIYQIPVLEGRYRDIEISNAILEFVDDDLGSVTEEQLIAHDEDLAHGFEGYSRRRRSSDGDGNTRDPGDITTFERDDLEQIRPYLSERLYEDLKALVAKLNAERSDAEKRISISAAVDLAIYEYCTNGRTQRNAELATEIRDEHNAMSGSGQATTADAGTDIDSDGDAEDEDEVEDYPYAVEDRLDRVYETIVDELGIGSIEECSGIPRPIVINAIDQWCTKNPDTDHATDRTREKYIERICDDLGLAESTSGKTLTELSGETPACDLESYDDLDDSQRIEAVRVNLLRDADNRADANAAQAAAADIQDYFEDSHVPKPTAHELRKKAIDGEVFVEGNRGGRSEGDAVVKVALGRVSDVELLRKAGLSDWADEIEHPEPVDESPRPEDESDESEIEDEAAEDMDAIMAGVPEHEVRADGGEDMT